MERYTADKWFSLYIRKRDAIKYGDGENVPCVTCGKWDSWKNMDCGHFITRNYQATRYNEKNSSCQCKRCNMHLHGDQFRHGQKIDQRWGEGTSAMLEASKRNYSKRGKLELKAISDEYREKFKALENDSLK